MLADIELGVCWMLKESGAGLNVLLAEDQESDYQAIETLLTHSAIPYEITRARSFQEAETQLKFRQFDVVLISIALLQWQESLLSRLRMTAPLVPMIVLARVDDTLTGLRALREGAQEYLLKDQLSTTVLAKTIRYAVERNKFEQKLKESEDRLRDLAENSRDLICTHDLEGNILWLNPFPAKLLGYETSELTSMKIQDILAPNMLDKFQEYLRSIEIQGEASGIMKVMTRQGNIRIWEYHNSLRTEGVSRPVIRGLAHDITEIIRTQEDLRQSQERFQLASRAAHDVIWDWNVREGTIWWSENLQRVFGYPFHGVLKVQWWKDQIHPEDVFAIKQKRAALFESGSDSYTFEYRFRCFDGHYSHVLERGFIVRESGSVTRVIGALIDISERIKYEEQLLISRKVEAIVRLAGGIAHDFNNLMMAIHVNAEILQLKLEQASSEFPEIAAILEAATKGSILTHQLLSFSRKQIMQPSAMDIAGFTLAIKPMLEDILGKGIACIVEPFSERCMIQADANLLREVFTIVAENSKEAMDGKGEFRIETRIVEIDQASAATMVGINPGRYVRLGLSDTGIGMPPEIKNRIFEPYFSTKGVGHGKGLSLASVYGIIKQSQGYIYLESEPDKGTTFHLYFPIESESGDR